MNRMLRILLLTASALTLGAQPVVTKVVNSASYTSEAAPGMLIDILGSGLAQEDIQPLDAPFPDMLGGTSVKLGSYGLELRFVDPYLLCAYIPASVPTGTYDLIVTTPDGTSKAVQVKLAATAPALFSVDGLNTDALVVVPDLSAYASGLRPGDSFVAYANGLGATDSDGNLVTQPQMVIGTRTATVESVGLTGIPGVYQLGFRVPSDSLTNEARLVGSTQQLSLPVSTGNVDNLSASISVTVPAAAQAVTVAPIGVVGKLQLAFDIAANAKPFSALLKTDSGREVLRIDFDTAAGTATATMALPTSAERQGNFSNSTNGPALDLLNHGLPFPGSLIPVGRLSPALLSAQQTVPLPNLPPNLYKAVVEAKTGTTFRIDDATNSYLSAFAYYWAVTAGQLTPGGTLTDRLTLFVDTAPVADTAVEAALP